MTIAPALVSSSPAISLSKVDLPHPDGPTKTTNSPASVVRSISGMMTVAPKDFDTFFSVIWPMASSPGILFDCAEGQAAHQLPLREPAHDQDWRDGQRRGRRKLGPEQPLRAGERGDERRQ